MTATNVLPTLIEPPQPIIFNSTRLETDMDSLTSTQIESNFEAVTIHDSDSQF